MGRAGALRVGGGPAGPGPRRPIQPPVVAMNLQIFSYDAEQGWSTPVLDRLDSPSTLVLSFGAARYADQSAPIQTLWDAFPNSHHLGCSTGGEILGHELRDDSLAVAAIQLEHGGLRTAFSGVPHPDDSFDAGLDLAEQLADPRLVGVFVLADGPRVNGSQLVAGLSERLGPSVPISGGLSGPATEGTGYCLALGAPAQRVVEAVGFYGRNVHMGHGLQSVWGKVGRPSVVTGASGRLLTSLDGRRATDVYRQALGAEAAQHPSACLRHPILLRGGREENGRLVRAVLDADPGTGSLLCAGDVPVGAMAQVLRADDEHLLAGVQQAAVAAGLPRRARGDVLAVTVSDTHRRRALGPLSEREPGTCLASLPAGTQQVGFYGSGLFAPQAGGSPDLLSHTVGLTTLWEE